MLLGYGDIVEAFRKLFGKFHHTRTFFHRRCNGDESGILCRHVAQPLAKDILEFAGLVFGVCSSGFGLLRIQFGQRVITHRISFGGRKAFAFLCDDMKELCAGQFA